MKTTIAFRSTDTGLTGDYTGGNITLDVVKDAYTGADLLSSAGNWTTTELGRGVYLLDLPGITVHAFISLTNTAGGANIKYDGYTDDFATAAIAVRDVDNTSPATDSLGFTVNSIETYMAKETTLTARMNFLYQLNSGNCYECGSWSGSEAGVLTVTFSGTLTAGGYINLVAYNAFTLGQTYLGAYTQAGGFVKNGGWATSLDNHVLGLEIGGVSVAGDLVIQINNSELGTVPRTITIPVMTYSDESGNVFVPPVDGSSAMMYGRTSVSTTPIATAVRDVNNSAPAAGSLGDHANKGAASYEMGRVIGMQLLANEVMGMAGVIQVDFAFSGTLTGTGYFSVKANDITSDASAANNSGRITFSESGTAVGIYDSTGWHPESINLWNAYLFIRTQGIDGISDGVITLTIYDGLGSYEYKVDYHNTGSDFYVWLGGDGKLIGYGGSGPTQSLHQPVRLPTYPTTDNLAIAAAVRDVDNSAPAGGSLGESILSGNSTTQRVMDRVLANEFLAVQDVVSISAAHTGAITGGAQIRIGLTQLDSMGPDWGGRKQVGYIEAGGAWVDAGNYSGDYAAAVIVWAFSGGGSIAAGTLTLTITDQQGTYTRDIILGSNAIDFFAYLGKEAGQLIGWAGQDSVSQETMFQTVREPSPQPVIDGVFNALPSAYSEGNTHSFANVSMRDHEMLDRLIESRSQDRLLVSDIDDFTATYSVVLPAGAKIDISGERQFPPLDGDPAVLIFGSISSDGNENLFEYLPNGGGLTNYLRGLMLEVTVTPATGVGFPAGVLTITRAGGTFPGDTTLNLELPAMAATPNFSSSNVFLFDNFGKTLLSERYGRFRADQISADNAAIAAAVRDVDNTAPAAGSLGERVNQTLTSGEDIGGQTVGRRLAVASDAAIAGYITCLAWDFTVPANVTITFDGVLPVNSFIKGQAHTNTGTVYLFTVTSSGVTLDYNGVVPYLSSLFIEWHADGGNITGGTLSITLPRSPGNANEPILVKIPSMIDGDWQEFPVGADGYLYDSSGGRFEPSTGADPNAIAIAVRDVANSNPAMGSLGEVVNSAANAATNAWARGNATQEASQKSYFHNLVSISGYSFTVAGGNPVTATFTGTIATGKRLYLLAEYEDGANTLRDRNIGYFDDTLTFIPEAAFNLDLSCVGATLRAYNDGGPIGAGTLTVTCSSLVIGTAPSTLELDVPALGDMYICYLHWNIQGRCLLDPLLATNPDISSVY